jgi:hypothetical protein
MSGMDAARFETLAETWGGVITRWPQDVREAGLLFLADQPEAARRLLAEAQALDEALDLLAMPTPTMTLREAIIAAAPAIRRRNILLRWLSGAGIGAALAAASVSGIVVGVQVSQVEAVDSRSEAVYSVSNDDDWYALPETESQS